METSTEDEVFSDSGSGGKSVGSSPRDSIRLSRYTLYHSALDLEEAMAAQDEATALSPLNYPPPMPSPSVKACTPKFRDGVRSVDFVLAWQEPKTNDRNSEEKKKKRQRFEEGLEAEGLELERDQVERVHFVKIHAPRHVLRNYCEVLKLRMPMKALSEDSEDERNGDVGGDFIITEVKSLFAKIAECLSLNPAVAPDKFKLTAQYSKHKYYLFDEDSSDFFTSQIRTLVVDFILERMKFSEGSATGSRACVGINRLISDDTYKAAYPLHDGGCLEADTLRNFLLTEWAQVKHWARFQPVDQIRDYFGVKFALYFAWLGFYTHMLIPASVVGIFVFIYGAITAYSDTYSDDICDEALNITMCPQCDRTCDYWKLSNTCPYAKATYLFDNPLTVVFAVFMSFWATLFLELWKRYSAWICHKWGLTDYCAQSEPPRPEYLTRLAQYKSTRYKRHCFTGETEPFAPYYRVTFPARLLSYSIIVLMIIIAMGAVLGVVLYRMSVLASLSLAGDSDWVLSYTFIIIPATAGFINLACTMALNIVYDRLAVYLTELELHRSQTEFDEALTVKIYLFQFVNYYTSIMYIAFLKGKFVGYPAKYNRIFKYRQEECSPGGCLMELCIQLAIIMVGQQAYNAVMEMLIPFVIKWVNTLSVKAGLEKKGSTDDVPEGSRKQWVEDYRLLDWGPRGLFYEYLEMVIQYGFVTLFVTAFPLAPLFALLNNIFEMRLDAKKFLKFYRRPVPRRAPDIGVWYRILNILGKLAVISNAFIIAFSSNFIPRMVYRMTVSHDKSDTGFLDHSLAYFDTHDFAPGTAPRSPSFNVSICRYWEYREPPWVDDPSRKYKRPSIYWHVLAARLAFIVIFQNIVSLVMICVQWCIPDVPAKLREKIMREAYLTNEMIIQHETRRAGETRTINSENFLARESEDSLRQRKQGGKTSLEEIELQERP